MDILVLISAMDLFRNIEQQSTGEQHEFDDFAPGWRDHVRIDLPQTERRAKVMEYWAACVAEQLGLDASSEMHAVTNSVNRLLYWLMLLSRHELAKKFWKIVLTGRPQRTREMFDQQARSAADTRPTCGPEALDRSHPSSERRRPLHTFPTA